MKEGQEKFVPLQDCWHMQVVQDPVADALDDMAALGLHWTRNRERGRMPGGIRQAMLLVAREALAHEKAQENMIHERFGTPNVPHERQAR